MKRSKVTGFVLIFQSRCPLVSLTVKKVFFLPRLSSILRNVFRMTILSL